MLSIAFVRNIETWYMGFGGSNYAKTSDEYTGSSGQVGATTTHQGNVIDATQSSGGGNTSAILAEVCKAITSPDPSGNGYYAVYIDTKRGHELSEARTDPANPGAWYDSSGAENGDKCAWTFNVPLVTFSNGSQWKIQGEWSNAAYTAGTGYPSSSGQKGCLDGH
jgi:hypothetical protein